MGVYIRGMEMPTSCGQCPLHDEDYRGKEHCDIGWKRIGKAEEKPDWCPLVHVPVHGRLIDADALAKGDWYLNRYVTDSNGCWIENMTLEKAPTIIPADEPFGNSEQLNV